MNKEQAVYKAAFNVVFSRDLSHAFPGFDEILEKLVQAGEVIVARPPYPLNDHLESFSFIKNDGTPEGYINVVQYTFDKNKFIMSNEFSQYASERSKALDEEALKKEREIYEARQESFHLKGMIVEGFRASQEERRKKHFSVDSGVGILIVRKASHA